MQPLDITPEMWALIFTHLSALFVTYVKISERLTKVETEMRIVLQSIGRARRAEDLDE